MVCGEHATHMSASIVMQTWAVRAGHAAAALQTYRPVWQKSDQRGSQASIQASDAFLLCYHRQSTWMIAATTLRMHEAGQSTHVAQPNLPARLGQELAVSRGLQQTSNALVRCS